MLLSMSRLARTAFLCAALVALPGLAGAGEGSEGGFGSGAVFVGRGGQVDRGVTFGFGEGRGVAVVGGGRAGSFERYEGGRRYEAPNLAGSRYRPSHRDGFYGDGVVVVDRGRSGRDLYRARVEERRQRFEDRRRALSDGSFIRLRDAGRVDRFERDPRYENRRDHRDGGFQGSRTLTTFDEGDWNGANGLAYGVPDPAGVEPGPGGPLEPVGPKILNVEAERLDRRPIGPSGLDVTTTSAGSRIIRIAPGYRMARSEAQTRPSAVRANDRDLGLQPWSAAWLRYCQRTHGSFDPDLGTYVAANGRVRFCSAD